MKLTEVETCMLRIALRRMAENSPLTMRDEPPGKSDYYNLASRLDVIHCAEISERSHVDGI